MADQQPLFPGAWTLEYVRHPALWPPLDDSVMGPDDAAMLVWTSGPPWNPNAPDPRYRDWTDYRSDVIQADGGIGMIAAGDAWPSGEDMTW